LTGAQHHILSTPNDEVPSICDIKKYDILQQLMRVSTQEGFQRRGLDFYGNAGVRVTRLGLGGSPIKPELALIDCAYCIRLPCCPINLCCTLLASEFTLLSVTNEQGELLQTT
jgi:hypothetical protein